MFKVWFCEPCNGSRLASRVAYFHSGPFCTWMWICTNSLFYHFQMPNISNKAQQYSNGIWRVGAEVVLLHFDRALGGWLHAKRQIL